MEINVYLNEKYLSCFKSPCVPRKEEELMFGATCYRVKQVFYNVVKYNVAHSEVDIIGLEVEEVKR